MPCSGLAGKIVGKGVGKRVGDECHSKFFLARFSKEMSTDNLIDDCWWFFENRAGAKQPRKRFRE